MDYVIRQVNNDALIDGYYKHEIDAEEAGGRWAQRMQANMYVSKEPFRRRPPEFKWPHQPTSKDKEGENGLRK